MTRVAGSNPAEHAVRMVREVYRCTGAPIIGLGGCDQAVFDSGGDIDYIVAPEGAVSMPDYRVTTHRFAISVPVGGP